MTPAREQYTHGHHDSVLRTHAWRTVQNSAAYLVPELLPGLTVLDVGSGPGTITLDLAARVAPGRVVGVDTSAEVTRKAADLAAEQSVTNVSFVVGDAYALDFEDASFDIVHAHQVLHHLADPVAALTEFRRVCKPGGVVAVREVDYAGTIWYPVLPGLAEWMALYQRVHRSNGGEPDAGRRLKAWAWAAGFTEVQSSASVWCFASDDERRWWGEAWAERAVASGFADTALASSLASPSDLARIRDAWLSWVSSPEGWLSMPHGEVLCRA
jgi:ubiquinone/menaquinone biosynthesis C-methylase UbiE